MNNISAYIRWRGDLDFSERKFNDVDNLIFSQLVYIDYNEVLPVKGSGSFTLKEAAELIFAEKNGKSGFKIHSFASIDPSFLKEAANCKRFKNVKLSNYVDVCDEALKIQFAAMSFELDDGSVYVAFRGTDQTITGWREDFTMSFQITPAQREAVRYLEQVMSATNKVFRVGGHSKGGNLAVYSSAMCGDNLKNRIIEIYDNDGPGFCKEILQSTQYNKIKDKIIRIVPEFSIIGMLFENDRNRRIVKSSSNGITQHDAMSWEVKSDCFEEADELTPECKQINQVFDAWIEDVDMEQRRIFTNNFFDALASSGAKELSEIARGGVKGFESILSAMVNSKQETKMVVAKFFKTIITSLHQIDYLQLLKSSNTLRGICVALLGLFFMRLPEHSLQIIGSITAFTTFCLAAQRLVHHVKNQIYQEKFRKYAIFFYIAVLILLLLSVWNTNLLIISVNFSLGIVLVFYGSLIINQTAHPFCKTDKFRVISWILGLISIAFGTIALVIPDSGMKVYIFAVGAFMTIAGAYEIISEIYKLSLKTP